MEVNPIRVYSSTRSNNMNDTRNPKEKAVQTEHIATEQKSQYTPNLAVEKKVTYEKPKVDHTTIGKLKEESDRAYNTLRSMVEELLRSQGKSFRDISLDTEIEVDEATRLEAQSLIDGELSAERVSDRIVEFAKAISGGDKAKFDLLKSAIEEGFKQAASLLGGQLPEVSQRTYTLVMEKLNQ